MRGTSAVMAAMAATMAVAHPGEDIEAEILERRNFIANTKHANLGHCAAKMQSDGHERRGIERRSELASRHAKRSHLMARASEDMDKSHLHADSGFTEKTPLSEIFASNASCVLSPEAILGPYCKK